MKGYDKSYQMITRFYSCKKGHLIKDEKGINLKISRQKQKEEKLVIEKWTV